MLSRTVGWEFSGGDNRFLVPAMPDISAERAIHTFFVNRLRGYCGALMALFGSLAISCLFGK